MKTLTTERRRQLERTVVEARDIAEVGARVALEALAVQHHEPYGHMDGAQRTLRRRLRAHARQLGDRPDARSGGHGIDHLVHECAYEHWHGMLFARFLAENHLLIEPEMGVAITLDECEELAKEERVDKWTLAARFAHRMLPQVFRPDHPVFKVRFAREHRLKLEGLVEGIPEEAFTATDSLGWVYQFWQTKKKGEVNAAGNKIGADELPAVTQLFTEDYMVDFLLDNTLGAWHAGRVLAANPKLAETAQSEDELRQAVSLPRCPWKYLRFIKNQGGKWAPAAGTFDGWPNTTKELKCLDPCMGSGHFVVAMFERLVALRMNEESLDEQEAVPSVIRDNLFGLELDPRCTQIGAFNLALAAWRRVGHCPLPAMNLACSGLAPNTRESDWLVIAGDNEKLRNGMERLYRLFQKAAVLGSLINPRAGEGDLLEAGFSQLQPLHVAVARLLGYQWPRQTGSSFPDCPALGPDGLEKLADDDGIVCVPAVRGERPAYERVLRVLQAAWSDDWNDGILAKLLAVAGSTNLEDWLRNGFFEQHCKLFHYRPFIWHIWDSRKRDGFHALVNYHKLAEGDGKGRRVLESLTYSYLGDWIGRQQDGVKRGEGGAEDRLAAALELQKRLVAILEGEPPVDLFVRWKSIEDQAIGWDPDINDGVRLNIRPFMARDLPDGKKGAGILRAKPNVHWKKDRGKEPVREQTQYPWFWEDGKFTGERVNDVHLTVAEKRTAREGRGERK